MQIACDVWVVRRSERQTINPEIVIMRMQWGT